MKNEKFILIDGNSLMHRAFYALPNLTNTKGMHTNVIYGFVNMLNKIFEEFKPDYMAIAFDRKAPTFRHEEYAEYKANRKKMPEEMAEQIPLLKNVIAAMNINQVELDGFEADDVIGTLSRYSDEMGLETLIVTGDRDAFQLISDKVHVMITKKGISDIVEYNEARLMEDYEIRPDQVTDMKGLMGDASDNIPGVPGVGEKTALELIKQYDKLEKVLDSVGDIKKNKLRENLTEYREQALFSKKLATIVRNVPVESRLEEYRLKQADNAKLAELYRELEFRSLLDKLGAAGSAAAQKEDVKLSCRELCEQDEFDELLAKLKKKGEAFFKICKGSTELSDYIYFNVDSEQLYFNINFSSINHIKQIMESQDIVKISHDIKQDILVLMELGIEVKAVGFDTMIAAYLINPSKSSYTLREICYDINGTEIDDYSSKEGVSTELYCSSVKAIAELKGKLLEKLVELNMKELYYKVELPLAAILADMEHEGFKVDKKALEELSADFASQIDELTKGIYEYAGEEFNINSTKQLGVILFDKLQLPVIKKTKTGYSTDVEVLEALSEKHPIIDKLLEYRQLVKLKSTYIDGLIAIINPKTGKVHSKLNQTVTATGRLSSTDPNLQNIPVKTENGRLIRKVFIPTNEEFVLVDADYSQIELRVLAHISDDPGLIDAFANKQDIHTRTASEVFGVPLGEVTSIMRSRAKAVNFGIVYGISDFGLSRDLKITKKEAKQYIDRYFARYPKVKEYMDETVKNAAEKGYVTTIMNRIRYIPEINSRNAIQRGLGERIAMNTPIQGSAADIIKIAMVKVYEELKKKGLKSKLILQVHDELIVEAHKDEADMVKVILKECMENAFDLKASLVADVKSGMSWYDAK
ncbi:MAG: DNA polymerase I [Bacillota bacterium]